jgi:hypothetical protein
MRFLASGVLEVCISSAECEVLVLVLVAVVLHEGCLSESSVVRMVVVDGDSVGSCECLKGSFRLQGLSLIGSLL